MDESAILGKLALVLETHCMRQMKKMPIFKDYILCLIKIITKGINCHLGQVNAPSEGKPITFKI